ncbi:meteorin-like [Tachysurus ichikawai]
MELFVWISVLMAMTGPSYSADECSWRGSGLARPEQGVEQVFLHCAEGSVEFLYPNGALRLTLLPRLPRHRVGGTSGMPSSVCVKPEPQWGGAQLYLEKGGILELLVSDTPGPSHIRCFSITPGESPALFLQATPHSDISRRIAAFRYELRGDRTTRLSVNSVDAEVDAEEGEQGETGSYHGNAYSWREYMGVGGRVRG